MKADKKSKEYIYTEKMLRKKFSRVYQSYEDVGGLDAEKLLEVLINIHIRFESVIDDVTSS